MTHDKVKLLKPDNKQLGRKAVRLVQLNLRFCILLSLLLVTVALIVYLNKTLHRQPSRQSHSRHSYLGRLFSDQSSSLKYAQNETEDETYDYSDDEFDLIWSAETVELFQDQLGIVISDEVKNLTCRVGQEFIVSALPGTDDQNLSDNLWQYMSLIALENSFAMHDEASENFSLTAFVTEQMRVVLDQIFEGLSPQPISSLPPSCYNLKYAKIIGSSQPISLKEIAPTTAPLLLDPNAKRLKEIAELFGGKMRPHFRFNAEILNEVQQEFLVTKTIQEVENEREMDVNFVGVYITADDKLPIEYYQSAMTFHRKTERTIFMIVCDLETLTFCQESFDGKAAVGDVRVIRKSFDTFDFVLMSSCNATIVSNDMGALHALVNNGDTTVYKPDENSDPEYYVPWLLSEQMSNFYAIDLVN